MKIRNYIFFLILIYSSLQICQAQNRLADSLQLLLKNSKEDTSKIKALNSLAWEIRESDPKKCINYSNQSLLLINKLQAQKNNSEFLNEWLELALSNTYTNFGILNNIVYSDKETSINYHLKALRLREKLAGSAFKQLRFAGRHGMGDTYKNLGSLYTYLDETKSVDFTRKSMALLAETGDKRGVSMCLGNIGALYEIRKDYDTALYYYEKSLQIAKEINNRRSISISLMIIGNIYLLKTDTCKNSLDFKLLIAKSLKYFEEALATANEINNKLFAERNLIYIATIYKKQGNFKAAIEYCEKSLAIAAKINASDDIINIYKELSEIYVLQHNYTKAYEYYYLYTQQKDSLYNSVSSAKIVQIQNRYENEKKEKEQEILNRLKEVENKAELDKQKLTRNSFITGFILVLIFSLVLINRLLLVRKQKRTIEAQKELVEEKQKEILDSIRYAKRIQKSLLPSDTYIRRVLKKHTKVS